MQADDFYAGDLGDHGTPRGVSPHRLFSFPVMSLQWITFGGIQMDKVELTIAQQLANAARDFQTKQTGRTPSNVTVAVGDDTLVFTLHEVLSPAEQNLAKSAEGAANFREYHQQLFRNSVDSLRQEIERITGRKVREAAAEVDTGSGSVSHTFTTGTTGQVFLMDGNVPSA